ncbi:hypothetical protein CLOAM0332 [Candidatus Cloacimonas acidaminovorans str. Evry]|uniref:Uncharacterized protein n=1 Tax=Cloacimonas acidaminovorans (strain Evry) TaxID=459349 RepID=B0VJR9_CLOAI|nr:hypothetical protein CLOAM0332 [Candidatus Cloacimonas acidaminovorans str. Evry]
MLSPIPWKLNENYLVLQAVTTVAGFFPFAFICLCRTSDNNSKNYYR